MKKFWMILMVSGMLTYNLSFAQEPGSKSKKQEADGTTKEKKVKKDGTVKEKKVKENGTVKEKKTKPDGSVEKETKHNY
jgi:hypothetical protein